jgi:hypothetical protein
MRQMLAPVAMGGLLAGLIGGAAEVAWIWSYQALAGGNAASVALGVAEAVGYHGTLVSPIAGGLAIHMALAALLGVGVALALEPTRERLGRRGEYAAVVATLAAVWAVNYFVVLPVVSPAFVTIVPYGVSLVSKLLFGVAAAWGLDIAAQSRAVMPQH